jgi:hypothetical protein
MCRLPLAAFESNQNLPAMHVPNCMSLLHAPCRCPCRLVHGNPGVLRLDLSSSTYRAKLQFAKEELKVRGHSGQLSCWHAARLAAGSTANMAVQIRQQGAAAKNMQELWGHCCQDG